MTRRSTPRDPEGRRRASVEFSGKKPRNQTQGGKAPKRPKTSQPRAEGRGARLGRRLTAVGRFGVKHRGSLTCVLGSIGVAVSLVVFEGTVQLLMGVTSLVAVGVGGAIHHHQRTKLMNRNPNVVTPTWAQRAAFEQAMRDPRKPYEPQGGGPVHVSGSNRAQSHTRARPGEARTS